MRKINRTDVLMINPNMIVNFWDDIKNDPDFPYQEMNNPQELIDLIKQGDAFCLGFQLILSSNLPDIDIELGESK